MPPHWSQCCDTPPVDVGGEVDTVVDTVVVDTVVEDTVVVAMVEEEPVAVVVEVPLVNVGAVQGAHCALGMGKVYVPAVVVMVVFTLWPNRNLFMNALSCVCCWDGKTQWEWFEDCE